MNTQRQKLVNKIHEQLQEKKKKILDKIPAIHTIDDGLVIRFFDEWDKCEDDNKVVYKEIDTDIAGEEITYFYLPKGTYLDFKERPYATSFLCLSGHVVLDVNGELINLTSQTKRSIDCSSYHGKVLKNTYIITSNLKKADYMKRFHSPQA